MTQNTIRALVFDCYGVFYADPSKVLIRQAPADKQDYLRSMRDQASIGRIREDDFIQAEATILGRSFDELKDAFLHGLARDQAVLDYAQSLRATYKVGMLSNISHGTMDSFFTRAEREKYFDAVVLSADVGMIKPQPEIFSLMCKRLGAPPEQAIMIDDTPANCAGARSVGMQAIEYTNLDALQGQLRAMLVEI